MTSFKIIHISDLHLCIQPNRRNFASLLEKRPSAKIDVARSAQRLGLRSLMWPASYVPSRLEALAEFVFDQSVRADGIVISGDLATSGTARDLKEAFSFVDDEADRRWFNNDRPVLVSRDRALVIIPGNHDNYNGNFPIPNPKNFALQFQKYSNTPLNDRIGHEVLIKDSSALLIITADLSFTSTKQAKGPKHLYGGGNADAETLKLIRERTFKLRRSPALAGIKTEVIWVIHFPPYECDDPSIMMNNHAAVIDFAKKSEVNIIMCGHTHQSKIEIDGKVKIFCAGSASAVDCENSVHTIDINFEDQTIICHDFVYSPLERQFEASTVAKLNN